MLAGCLIISHCMSVIIYSGGFGLAEVFGRLRYFGVLAYTIFVERLLP